MKRQNIASLYQKQKYAKYELCKKIPRRETLGPIIWDIKRGASTPMHQCTIASASMQQQHQYAAEIVHQQYQFSSNTSLAAPSVQRQYQFSSSTSLATAPV